LDGARSYLGCRPAPAEARARARRLLANDVAVMQNGGVGEMGVADAVLRYPRSTCTRTLLAAVARIQHA
jgi:ABC-type microcin C transport system duplicated ATPase subunit YejF